MEDDQLFETLADYDAALEGAAQPEGDPAIGLDAEPAVEAQQETALPQPDPEVPQQQDFGPGDVRRALAESRQELAQWRQYAQQLAEQIQQYAPQEQAPEQGVDPLDRDAFEYQQIQLGQMRQQMDEQMTAMRLEMSEQFARSQYPDYDQVISTLNEFKGLLNLQGIVRSQNPAMAAYQLAKRLSGDPSAALAQQVQSIVPKLAPQSPVAPKTLGNLPAAAPNTPTRKDPSAVSAQKLANLTPSDLQDWHLRALSGG